LRSTPDCPPRRAFLHLSCSCATPFGPAILVTQDPTRTLFCEGVSPKKSLVKIGEPSHTSTRFFATRFFQMPARGRGGKSEGAKKNHAMGSGDGQLCETPCPPKRCGLSRLAQGKLILAASTFSMVKDALGSMQWNVDHCPVAMQLKKPEGRLCSTRSSGSFCSRLRSATNGCRGMHSRNANPQVPSPGRAARFRATP
jgi:hypothetical protein